MAKLQLFNTYTFPGEHYRSVKRPRLGIAALHYNENCNRDQATTKDGQQCFNTCYPKKGTHAIAKPRTPPPSFEYVALIKQAVVE